MLSSCWAEKKHLSLATAPRVRPHKKSLSSATYRAPVPGSHSIAAYTEVADAARRSPLCCRAEADSKKGYRELSVPEHIDRTQGSRMSRLQCLRQKNRES